MGASCCRSGTTTTQSERVSEGYGLPIIPVMPEESEGVPFSVTVTLANNSSTTQQVHPLEPFIRLKVRLFNDPPDGLQLPPPVAMRLQFSNSELANGSNYQRESIVTDALLTLDSDPPISVRFELHQSAGGAFDQLVWPSEPISEMLARVLQPVVHPLPHLQLLLAQDWTVVKSAQVATSDLLALDKSSTVAQSQISDGAVIAVLNNVTKFVGRTGITVEGSTAGSRHPTATNRSGRSWESVVVDQPVSIGKHTFVFRTDTVGKAYSFNVGYLLEADFQAGVLLEEAPGGYHSGRLLGENLAGGSLTAGGNWFGTEGQVDGVRYAGVTRNWDRAGETVELVLDLSNDSGKIFLGGASELTGRSSHEFSCEERQGQALRVGVVLGLQAQVTLLSHTVTMH